MGDPDPTNLIISETNRIPFKAQPLGDIDWTNTFRSWPGETIGWREWYNRMCGSQSGFWDDYNLTQCITLSLANMKKNEPLLKAAALFWSDTLNCFMFRDGPAAPTLADVIMITGLDVSSADSPGTVFNKPNHRLDIKKISGGWKGYISHHQKTGTVVEREHVAFLNMWLEKFIFCGKTVGPAVGAQSMAEAIARGQRFPLGKHLLGSVYHLLHEVTEKIIKGEPIGNLGGPWWFIQLWLNIFFQSAFGYKLTAMGFPKSIPDQESAMRRCTNYGEAAAMCPVSENEDVDSLMSNYFALFYDGVIASKRLRFSYAESEAFEYPVRFRLISGEFDNADIRTCITPCILPVNLYSSRNNSLTYEFYYPSALARQFGMGQLPVRLCFADIVQPRNPVPSSLAYSRLKDQHPDVDFNTINLNGWVLVSFASDSFRSWWSEWSQHLFSQSTHHLLHQICASHEVPEGVSNLSSTTSSAMYHLS